MDYKNYKPFGERVIIRHLEDKETSIVKPKSAEVEEKAIGEVVVGSKEIQKGIKVIYDEFAGSYIPDEKDLIILDIKDILAIYE